MHTEEIMICILKWGVTLLVKCEISKNQWYVGTENHSLRILLLSRIICYDYWFLGRFSLTFWQLFPCCWICFFCFVILYFAGKICVLNQWASFIVICMQFGYNFALFCFIVLVLLSLCSFLNLFFKGL